MKKIILFYSIFIANCLIAQSTGDENKNIPNIIPPSPSVNSLMKFEEVPVSNYTGIPDITIPIKSLNTGLNNVPLNLQLKYHVNNAKSDSKATEVGLGWSLMAGGTISRTVMDIPDEKIISYSSGSSNKKIGIYFDENTNVHNYKNYFGSIIDNPGNFTHTEKSIFEAHYKNRYDTKYDLYQYNFLNYTGRFIIKKINGQLQVVKLDKNNLKITVTAPTDFEPISFDIIDELGNIFVFDVIETSKNTSLNDGLGLEGYTFTSYSEMNYMYNSAFHLSKIKNNDNTIKVNLTYDAQPVVTVSTESTKNNNAIYFDAGSALRSIIRENSSYLPKIDETIGSTTISNTRKIKEINLLGQGSILFDYEYGREDTNYGSDLSSLSKLRSIVIKGTDNKYDEKFNFIYAYKNSGVYKRLFLTSIEKLNKDNDTYVRDQIYNLDYYGLTGISFPLVADDDSFYKCSKEYSYGCSNIELLKAITYPTKGKSEFIYETGTYSYIPKNTAFSPSDGAELLTNYDENQLNWDDANNMTVFTKFSDEKKFAFTITELSSIRMQLETVSINQYGFRFRVLKKEGVNYTPVASFDTSLLDANEPIPTVYEYTFPAGEYYLELDNLQIGIGNPTFNASFNIFYKVRNTNNLKYLFDFRNVRIKNINYYTDQTGIPSRTINFGYNDLLDSKRSTGALVFPKPLYRYSYPYKATLEYQCNPDPTHPCKTVFSADIVYNSSRNFLPIQKTKGGDIGYQFVSVNETGKGKTVYQYTSPIDKPNLYTPSLLPPFNSVANYDYMRGNLLNKKVYSENNRLLSEDKLTYQYNDYEISTGAFVNLKEDAIDGYYLHGGKYETYENFSLITGKNAFDFMTLVFQKEHIGTANLIEEQSTMFYDNQRSVTQSTLNGYNSRDYLIKKSQTLSDGTIVETNYSYAHEKGNTRLINANIIAAPLETSVVKKQNSADLGKIILKAETKYDDLSHLFPTSMVSYDFNNIAQTEVTYNEYDINGNILQYTTKDGMAISIIWGYNSTQPIAKIVGVSYSVASGLATDIISASNTDVSQGTTISEENLINKLDAFRKESALQNAQITTYTYDPLIGVTSITPPSGIREIYKYDSANRLESIKDINGKLLKEFKYNYKP
ncbi:hypothetical protein [Chryseobacterium sp. YIM B08800]|uniref:hypothetical protein n=1 Tax=Chryseobacterium sp. YIM B08800 TaxID=2984136 RepID=UPI0022401A85|nr:hypothetical protein [Chryseobacterium sp. YIM B08800]